MADIIAVAESKVASRVEFNNRKVTDKWFGAVYILFYVSFLSCGIYLVTQSQNRFTVNESGVHVISDFYIQDAEQCCATNNNQGLLCLYLQGGAENRRLQAGNSSFDGDEGVFDALMEAPEIPIGVISFAIMLAVLWLILLRFFAKPIVVLVEILKVGVFIALGTQQNEEGPKIICFAIACGFALYTLWAWKKLLFAAKMIKESTIAMKENPSVLVGGLLLKILFVGNAALFIWFFSESFNVVRVGTYSIDDYYSGATYSNCDFVYPQYVQGISIFISVSYLWTVLLLDKIRLSIIANLVGSWHFHPKSKISLTAAIRNIVPSFGTLSVAALISTIAEKINQALSQGFWSRSLSSCFLSVPLDILLCLVGRTIKTLIQMMTKFSVILHVFTGDAFSPAAKKAFNILSRHFKGGFVAEVTSKGVLNFGAYAFSLATAMVTWIWIDDRFNCGSLERDDSSLPGAARVVLYMLLIVFNTWYPVLGIYIIILINKFLRQMERDRIEFALEMNTEQDDISSYDNTNHLWIPPLAASFIGCISMMFFSFLSTGVILDIIDTLFLCYAIDTDNDVHIVNAELVNLIKEVPAFKNGKAESDANQNV